MLLCACNDRKLFIGIGQMKRLTIILIILIFVNTVTCMHKSHSEKQYSSEHLEKIADSLKHIKYFISMKQIQKILPKLEDIRRLGAQLDVTEKKQITDDVVMCIKLLPLSEQWQKEFDDELYYVSGLSSNESSPRVDDNNPYAVEVHHKSGDLSTEFNVSLLDPSKKKPRKFIFLDRVIKKISNLIDAVQTKESDFRIAAQDGSMRRWNKAYQSYQQFLHPDFLSLNYLNSVNKAYIHYAVSNDHGEMIRYLLDKGANIEQADMFGRTPLLQALIEKKGKAVKALLKYNANPFMSNKRGNSREAEGSRIKFHPISEDEVSDIFVLAALYGKRMQKKLKSYINNLSEDTLLRFYAQAGRLEEMKKCIHEARDSGALINSVDLKSGKSALHYAVEEKELQVIATLFHIDGIDLNIQDCDGNTPLHEAVQGEYFEGVVLLIFGYTNTIKGDPQSDKGANGDIKNMQGYTPKEIAELLSYDAILTVFNNREFNKSDPYAYIDELDESTILGQYHEKLDSNESKLGDSKKADKKKRSERRKSMRIVDSMRRAFAGNMINKKEDN